MLKLYSLEFREAVKSLDEHIYTAPVYYRAKMVDIPVLILLIQGVVGSLSQVNKFPANFLLGTSTASYQIEGAWNEDGMFFYLQNSSPSTL